MKTIAKLKIEGVIEKENQSYNQKWLLDTIKSLEKKKKVIGIILYINSPGGGVYESDEVYMAIKRYKEKTGKPVYAYLASLAASGGYYIAASADKIIANRNTLTGSIGVICGRFVDLSEPMAKYGVKIETIHTGRNKIMGSFEVPPTDEQRSILQSLSDECYEQFTSIVADSRRLDIDKVKGLADGRVYSAKQAKENGLIDEIAELGDVKDIFLKDLYGEKKKAKANIVEYKPKCKKSLMSKFMKGAAPSTPLDAIKTFLKEKTPYPAYYFDAERFGR